MPLPDSPIPSHGTPAAGRGQQALPLVMEIQAKGLPN